MTNLSDKKPEDTKVLVVGGGFAGMCSAITLSKLGYQVDLVDLDPEWRVYGAGITINGTTLRAYRHLGMYEEIAEKGAIVRSTLLYRADGVVLREMAVAETVGEEPATAGIMRPILHEMMSSRVRQAKVSIKLGVKVETLTQSDTSVTVTLSDGSSGTYDLLIGSDGIGSEIRQMVFPETTGAKPMGQGCWRIAINRPEGMDKGEIYFGHKFPAGITLCGPDAMYMWMLTPDDGSLWVDDKEGVSMLRDRLEGFGGNIGWIGDNMNESHWVNYRPLEALIQPKDSWVKGRVVLVGDSAHATTPHLASGAGMAVEGAVVLSQELSKEGQSIDDALTAYVDRRYDRCRDVVESGVQIGKAQLANMPPEELGQLMGGALHRLAQPF